MPKVVTGTYTLWVNPTTEQYSLTPVHEGSEEDIRFRNQHLARVSEKAFEHWQKKTEENKGSQELAPSAAPVSSSKEPVPSAVPVSSEKKPEVAANPKEELEFQVKLGNPKYPKRMYWKEYAPADQEILRKAYTAGQSTVNLTLPGATSLENYQYTVDFSREIQIAENGTERKIKIISKPVHVLKELTEPEPDRSREAKATPAASSTEASTEASEKEAYMNRLLEKPELGCGIGKGG
jgi:hypothetical protein